MLTVHRNALPGHVEFAGIPVGELVATVENPDYVYIKMSDESSFNAWGLRTKSQVTFLFNQNCIWYDGRLDIWPHKEE